MVAAGVEGMGRFGEGWALSGAGFEGCVAAAGSRCLLPFGDGSSSLDASPLLELSLSEVSASSWPEDGKCLAVVIVMVVDVDAVR